MLDVAAASTSDGLCPPGNTVLGVRVHYLPHRLDDGFTSELVASMTEAAMRPLLLALPELEGKVLASELLTPFDLAERFGVHGGHLEHGEMALDQIAVRPTPECVGYRTPVSGLLLASSGSHPGGGITGVPGALAAKAVLKSL